MSCLRFALIEMSIRNPIEGQREGQSIEDLEFKPPNFIRMRPPSGGILERLMPVCEFAKGTCPSRINTLKHLHKPDPTSGCDLPEIPLRIVDIPEGTIRRDGQSSRPSVCTRQCNFSDGLCLQVDGANFIGVVFGEPWFIVGSGLSQCFN